jgi:hypothetical protein
MFLEKNLQPLLTQPAFVAEFKAFEATTTDNLDWMVVETSSGLSLVINGIPLHSLNGAEAEAQQLVASKLHPGKDNIHLIFGLGFAYMVQEVLALSEGQVLIFEPNWPLLKFLLTEVDYSELLANPRVQLCASTDQLAYSLKRIMDVNGTVDGKLDGLISPGAAALFTTEAIQGATRVVEQVLGQQYNYFRMGLMLNPSWQLFSLSNTVHLSKAKPFSALNNVFADKPAIILSAGPSLEYYLPDLLYWKDRVVTIAVPQALHALQKAGFTPDFVAVLDYEGLEHQLNHIDTSKVQFLNGPFAHPLAFTSPAKDYYLVNFSNYANLADWYNDATGVTNQALGSGGTVSLLAVGMANAMGCNPITILGQDLAFRGTQQYAGNVHVQIQGDHFVREESHISKEMRLKVVDIPGQQGEILKTSPDYLMFRDQFADMAKELQLLRPDLRLFNASVGGADIPGFTVCALPDLAEQEGWVHSTLIAKHPLTTVSQLSNVGFIAGVQQLQHRLNQALALIDPLLKAMAQWQKAIRNRGATAERSRTLDDLQGHFVEALQADWLIYGYLGQEIWSWQKMFTEVPVSVERVAQEMQYVQQIERLLRDQLQPVVQDTLAALKTQNLVIS